MRGQIDMNVLLDEAATAEVDESSCVRRMPRVARPDEASMRFSRLGAAIGVLRTTLAAAGLLASCGISVAQQYDCARLQQQINAAGGGNPAEAQKYAAAAQRQRTELDRTMSYSRSIGCGQRQFLFFGDPPPAQCPALEGQIARMQRNYEQLAAQTQQFSGESQRRALMARFDTYCRGATQPQTASRGFLESLFGGPDPRQGMRDMPIGTPDGVGDIMPMDDVARGGSKAVCVRTCDGGFFPVSYGARGSNLGNLEELCHALCPNAETQLFTYSPSRDIDSAVSTSGSPYSSLANAGKYRTKFDPSCTCKPPNQGWAQALADAERLLGDRGRDIIVTPEKAEELSRAKAPAALKAAPKGKGDTTKSAAATPATPPAAALTTGSVPTLPPNDPHVPGAMAVPNASGLAIGDASKGTVYGAGDGPTREVPGPDGVKRKVRIVGPTL
jgi:hypothetical protein